MRNSLWVAIAVIAVAAVAIVYMLTNKSPTPTAPQPTQTAGGQTGGQTGGAGGQQQGISVAPGEWKLICPPPEGGATTGATGGTDAPSGDETAATTESGTPPAAGQEAPKPSKCLINYQVKTAGEEAKVIAGVNIRLFGPQKQPVLIVRLPPAAKAGSEVVFVIDNNQPFKAPLKPENCDEKACIVRAGLPAAVVEQLKAGKAMAVVFFTKPESRARAPVALATFNAAFAQLLTAE